MGEGGCGWVGGGGGVLVGSHIKKAGVIVPPFEGHNLWIGSA